MMDVSNLLRSQREFFLSGATRGEAWRRDQLSALGRALEARESLLTEALREDLGRSAFQAHATEFGCLRNELATATRHLRRWMRARSASSPWLAAPARASVIPEPLGVSLILGPWNYPVLLCLAPLVSAIAAGNCAIVKPSETASATSTVLEEMLRTTFPAHFVAALQGGPELAGELLRHRFDKIFFTGSSAVGRQVMAAAAVHLTPVTLELGGKNPAIICADSPLELAARRIAWGKFLNAGQICVAPDFVAVPRKLLPDFAKALASAIREFFGENPSASEDFGRIINRRHWQRLLDLLESGKILAGGQSDPDTRFLAPTLLEVADWDSPAMKEEIFGPILPLLPYDHLDDVVDNLARRPIPLAAYIFTKDRRIARNLLARVRSGGACINDTVAHITGTSLPFGGLGESGMGSYHGKAGFDAFSHHRAVLRRSMTIDLPFRYPPARIALALLKRSLPWLLRD